MYFRNISILLILLFIVNMLPAQEAKVSSKTKIKKVVLKNGLTYYLYNNPASRGKIDFYLIQNVGAVLEEDNQNGLAHFLEHMCFKGTKNFPGRSIMNLFESKGLKNSINAFTGLDETVYYLKGIPTKDKEMCDNCLVILHDWCDCLSLTNEAIDTERPVIVEEMRTRRNLAVRLSEKYKPLTHNNTAYGKRFVAGTPEIIKNFKREELVEFYKDWYRTDLQAVAVIGDFDMLEMETKVRNLFSSISAVKNSKQRSKVIIPDNEEIYYTRVSDKELTTGGISIKVRHELKNDLYTKYVTMIVNRMIRNRVSELMKKEDQPLASLVIKDSKIALGYNAYEISLHHKQDRAKEALKAAFELHKDILDNGFTEAEYNKVKDEIFNGLKGFKRNFFYYPNKIFYELIKANFLEDINIYDGAAQYNQFKKIVKDLSLEDIRLFINKLYSDKNKTIIVFCNGKDKEYLTKEQIIDIEKNAKAVKIIPGKEKKEEINTKDLYIYKGELKGSSVDKVEKLDFLNAEKWTLANGATVIFKENSTNVDQVFISCQSPGGCSLYSGDKLLNAQAIVVFKKAFVLGNYNYVQLSKEFKESGFSHSFSISDDREEILTASKYSSVEKAFECICATFKSPYFDKNEYNKTFDFVSKTLKSKTSDLSSELSSQIKLLIKGEERAINYDEKYIERLSFEEMKKIYRERFSDASNFTFYIVGGIGRSKAKKLAEKYIGSLPSTHSNESYKKIESVFPKSYTKKELRFDMVDKKAGNKCFVRLNKGCDLKDRVCYYIIKDYLQDRLNKVLRESMNGTYGVSVKFSTNNTYDENSTFVISYECNPEKTGELNKALQGTLDLIAKTGIDPNFLKGVLKKYAKSPTSIKRDNAYYITLLETYIEKGEDRSAPDLVKKTVESIDLNYINTQMKNFFEKASVLDVIYLPKN